MNHFLMNGILWRVRFVAPDSLYLVDRTNQFRVATTDPKTKTVYLSDELSGDFLARVFVHELGHCAIFSYDLFEEIHRMVFPSQWIAAEEWVCNFIADYGWMIFSLARDVLGDEIWDYTLHHLDRLIA